MKTGIFIRVGKDNVDIVDAQTPDVISWLITLSPTAQGRLVIKLLEIIRGGVHEG